MTTAASLDAMAPGVHVPETNRSVRIEVAVIDVDDVDALWLRVKDASEVVDPLARTPWGSYKFVIADPDGFKLGFVARRHSQPLKDRV